ncbi:hypothetical protein BGY98DRAFT_238183 [Russula aff. rugulosa BPL654]|nr:hypothetical protein BGY98DRAFT_238183 [Russula aff. rugulosa BPL654]
MGGSAMGWRMLVVQTRPRLPKMAEPHTRVTILPGSLPCLYYGTPVADMLTHSPPLPLVIDFESRDITAEIKEVDEEEIILALVQRDRVRRIRLSAHSLRLQKFIRAIDGEYPILEYLILDDPWDKSTVLILPETLQTPHLRQLTINCSIPIRFQLLTTAVGLVTLNLSLHHPSTYFQPTVLLQSLSLMPQLEDLVIIFCFALLSRDVERQLMRTPITTHVTLPNLRSFEFQAVNAYEEAVLSGMTASRLEDFLISYHEQLTFSLVQFMGRIENLRFNRAMFRFDSSGVYVHWWVYVHCDWHVNLSETNMPTSDFVIIFNCWHLDWQVSSVAQIFNALSQIFSAVEHLTLTHKDNPSFEERDEDRTEWRKLLRSFSNVKTLCVRRGLVGALSRCLRLDDGEHPLELLPELQELIYPGSSEADDAFTQFINARRNAGRPVTLIED